MEGQEMPPRPRSGRVRDDPECTELGCWYDREGFGECCTEEFSPTGVLVRSRRCILASGSGAASGESPKLKLLDAQQERRPGDETGLYMAEDPL